MTTMTGLTVDRCRAIRENLRGLPIVSRYRPTASVAGSSIQYCIRSLLDRSARLPAEANTDSPRLRRCTLASSPMASVPLSANRPSRPTGGRDWASEAFNGATGLVLMMPNDTGPTTRIPACRARSRSCCCNARPCGPDSAKWPEGTTRVRTPMAAHSSTTPSTFAAGTAMTAISTGPGSALTRA